MQYIVGVFNLITLHKYRAAHTTFFPLQPKYWYEKCVRRVALEFHMFLVRKRYNLICVERMALRAADTFFVSLSLL